MSSAWFFKSVMRMLPFGATIASLMLLGVLAAPSLATERAQPFVIRNVRLFDGHRVFEHRSVLVGGGVIRAIGGPDMPSKGAQVIDGKEKTLLPGIIDTHVHVPHVDTRNALIQSARFGVTTDLDMFTGQETLKTIKQIEKEDAPGMADLRSAGVGASATGGHPSDLGGGFPTIDSPEQAEAFIAGRVAEGSDYIKLVLEDNSAWQRLAKPIPTLSPATVRAVVAAAHRHGKLAVAHISTESEARQAINAGVDGLAHLFVGERASPDFGRFAAKHHVFVIPTLTVQYSSCGRSDGTVLASDPRVVSQSFPSLIGNLKWHRGRSPVSCEATDEAIKELRDAHVPILVGTDAPVPGSTYGASTLDEMALVVADGLTPVEALIAGTSAPAKAFHLNDRGEIRVGKRADLVLIDGDPTRYIDSVKNISGVWKRGLAVPRVTESPAKPAV
jgi:imidazolonepropionase-like amidohydrolase